MAAEKNVLGLINTGRKILDPPWFGISFFMRERCARPDLVAFAPGCRPGSDKLLLVILRNPKTSRRPALPHHLATVVTPAGLPAVEITPSVARGSLSSMVGENPVMVRDVEARRTRRPHIGQPGCARASRRWS